jgi:AraC-like DNA-binding protein
MYVRRLTLQQRPSVLSLLLHTAPAAALLGLLTPFYVLSAAAKVEIIKGELAAPWDFLNWPLLIAAAQVMGYWVASLFALRRFNTALREHYSALNERSFDWLQRMLSITLGMWIVWVIGLLFHAPWSQWFAAVAVPPGVYLLAFFGLRQPALFADEAAGAAPARVPSRYARSGLDRERVPELRARLESVMRSEKPWLEADLTLADLATRASLSPHNLSQLLNEELDQSFFDYINSHRVAEVKRCLLDPAYGSQAILEIARASGFSSKTAFNAAFRQHAGVTPSEFRRSRRQSGAQLP